MVNSVPQDKKLYWPETHLPSVARDQTKGVCLVTGGRTVRRQVTVLTREDRRGQGRDAEEEPRSFCRTVGLHAVLLPARGAAGSPWTSAGPGPPCVSSAPAFSTPRGTEHELALGALRVTALPPAAPTAPAHLDLTTRPCS